MIDYYTDTREDELDYAEYQLYELIMQYREGLGLPSIPLSKALTITAGRHVLDTVYNLGEYDGHTWSDAPYISGDLSTADSSWFAPDRIGTGYTDYGFEISIGYRNIDPFDAPTMTPQIALDGWRESPPHNDVIVNEGAWSQDWKAIGIAIYESVSHVWFGRSPDPTGAPDFAFQIGSDGNDMLSGDDGNEEFFGGRGADTVEGDTGDDLLDGGEGEDIALFSGASGHYVLTIDGTSDQLGITDKRPDGTGDDTLESIELLKFGDGFSFGASGVFDLRLITGAVGLSEAMLTTLVEMYVAYFDRAPDSLGLLYWGTRLEDGMELGQIAQSFFFQDETFALYPELEGRRGVEDPSSLPTSFYETLVDDTYDKLLERDPDAEGRAYWIDALEDGDVRLGEFVLAVINGAKFFDTSQATPAQIAQAEEDVQTVQEKGQLGYAFAVEHGMNDLDNARDVMGTYDIADRAGTIAAAEALIAEYRADAEAADSAEILVQVTTLGEDPLAIA